jgi:transcriptional regulator with XRE-family HTH domain
MAPILEEYTPSLKQLREAKALSQVDLARITGVSVATISLIEKGTRKPGQATKDALARVLGVLPDDINPARRGLKEYRRARRLSRRDLARISGVSWADIGDIERGFHAPGRKTRLALARALGLRPADLLPAQDAVGPRSLKEWRLAKSVTMNELHAISGVSLKTIVSIEKGRYPHKDSTKMKIAQALGLRPSQIRF